MNLVQIEWSKAAMIGAAIPYRSYRSSAHMPYAMQPNCIRLHPSPSAFKLVTCIIRAASFPAGHQPSPTGIHLCFHRRKLWVITM